LLTRGGRNVRGAVIVASRLQATPAQVKQAVWSLDMNLLTMDRVNILLKTIPTDAEMELISQHAHDPVRLGQAEQFCLELMVHNTQHATQHTTHNTPHTTWFGRCLVVRISRRRPRWHTQSVPRLRQRLQCVLVRLEFTETLRELQAVRSKSDFMRHRSALYG
jgi:hypothetical protein